MSSGEDRSLVPLDPDQAERLHKLAHDLKNRVGGVLEAVRLLHERHEGMDPAELSTFAERNLFQALREIESALDDLGVERGTNKIRTGPVDLSRTASETLADVRSRLQRKQQTVTEEISPDVRITGDGDLLRQLMNALLTNASKFSSAGSAIHFSVVKQDGQAVVSVRDHGVGLSADDLRDLFVRYAWLGSRSTAGEGQARSTLARARQWAHLHQGSLEAASEGLGRGTTFTLRLPAL